MILKPTEKFFALSVEQDEGKRKTETKATTKRHQRKKSGGRSDGGDQAATAVHKQNKFKHATSGKRRANGEVKEGCVDFRQGLKID